MPGGGRWRIYRAWPRSRRRPRDRSRGPPWWPGPPHCGRRRGRPRPSTRSRSAPVRRWRRSRPGGRRRSPPPPGRGPQGRQRPAGDRSMTARSRARRRRGRRRGASAPAGPAARSVQWSDPTSPPRPRPPDGRVDPTRPRATNKASSQRAQPVTGDHRTRSTPAGAATVPLGSYSEARSVRVRAASAVASSTSGFVEVDTTAPRAPRTVGTTSPDVFPDRGGPRTSTACSAGAHIGPADPGPEIQTAAARASAPAVLMIVEPRRSPWWRCAARVVRPARRRRR